MVRGGAASPPASSPGAGADRIDYPSLSGRLRLETGAGQFNKLEPGVGRLGILSLQSLPHAGSRSTSATCSPKRFAFDRISGSIDLPAVCCSSEDLEIRGRRRASP